MPDRVIVVGGGLAGCEAAWQIAERGIQVELFEMRPHQMTPAHAGGGLAELVCSNSLGSSLPDRALGLLKNELRRLGSVILACADGAAIRAGNSLAVGREAFSEAVTAAIEGHPRIQVVRRALTEVPTAWPTILATGPLTSPEMASAISRIAGQENLYFYDAMAPVVTGDSVDMTSAWRGNRYQRGDDGDYINCPLSREEYELLVAALRTAQRIQLRDFETDEQSRSYFEACLPIEVLAERNIDALAYGPMRPVGLRDPRSDRRPHAVVQLRQDNRAGTLFNLVGFQTNLRWSEQDRVLRMIPALANAEFVRFGQMHRNTFLNSPALLNPTLQWRTRPDLFLAGQISGTEGYVGSTASGLLAGLNAARLVAGSQLVIWPEETMMGALVRYITTFGGDSFQPMKANMGLLPPIDSGIRGKRARHAALAERAVEALERALEAQGIAPVATPGRF